MMAVPLRPIVLAVALVLAIGTMNVGVARAEHKSASPGQAEIEGMIHQYLLEHRGVVLEAVEICARANAPPKPRMLGPRSLRSAR